MTLNQIIKRIQTIALSHQQVRNFQFGEVTEFLNDRTTEYPSVFVQDLPSALNLAGKDDTLNIKLYCLDLVNVAGDTKDNELDVQSDMLTLGKGIISLMNNQGTYTDWAIGGGSYQLVIEQFGDMVAGATFDLTIRTQWDKSYCEEPIL